MAYASAYGRGSSRRTSNNRAHGWTRIKERPARIEPSGMEVQQERQRQSGGVQVAEALGHVDGSELVDATEFDDDSYSPTSLPL